MEKGRLHIYTGDGKGKTTAALGLAVRFFGSGGEVFLVQFVKGIKSSEVEPLEKLGITVLRDATTQKFVFQMTQKEKSAYQSTQTQLLEAARKFMVSGSGREKTKVSETEKHKLQESARRLIILDEVFSAIEMGIIEESEVLALLDIWQNQQQDLQAGNTAASIEIVLTGRNPGQAFLDCADYISEICMRKHPYNIEGTPARAGVEF